MKKNKENQKERLKKETRQAREMTTTPMTNHTAKIACANKEIDDLLQKNEKSNASNEGFIDGLKAAKDILNKRNL